MKRGLQCVTAGYDVREVKGKAKSGKFLLRLFCGVTRAIGQHKNSFAHLLQKSHTLCRPVDCHFSYIQDAKGIQKKDVKAICKRAQILRMHRLFGHFGNWQKRTNSFILLYSPGDIWL